MINLIYLTVLLPLIGFLFNGLFGSKIKNEKIIGIIGSSTVGISFLIVVGAFIQTLSLPVEQRSNTVEIFTWLNVAGLNIKFAYLVDQLSLTMGLIVTGVGFLIHIYSIGYMHGDKGYWRFFSYLNLFIFAMINLILGDNFLVLFLGWEGVGLCSYLLIGFWYDRNFEKGTTSQAAKKAFVVNRIGDFGFLLGMFLIYFTFDSLNFKEVFAKATTFPVTETTFSLIALFLFIGATGKSAQIPLFVWLPDAMAGPTPVSALIHAATMVTAGVYMVSRASILFASAPFIMIVVAVIGLLTALMAASIGLVQNDIKKVLAYSTVSQLGYMVMALGVGAYKFAFFHLVTHAFFKAALFLGSGSVIHAMHHEQDIRKMGGLRKKLPLTYATFLISTLAISGVPLTSGFLSKDGILAGTFAFGNLTGQWFFAFVGFLVALVTAFYMFRLVILTFHGEPRDKEKFDHAHESPFVMVMPLVVLATLSIFIWYTPNPFNPEQGWFLSKWVKAPTIVTPQDARYSFLKSDEIKPEANVPTVQNVPAQTTQEINGSEEEVTFSKTYTEAMEHAHIPAMMLSLGLAGIGILFAFMFYQWKKLDPDKLAEKINPLYKLSLNKWYFDEIYDATFVALTLGISKLFAWFDNYIIDGIVNGSAALTKQVSNFSGKFDNIVVDGVVNGAAYLSGIVGLMFRRLQTGKVQTYIVLVVFSLVIILFIFKSF